ncbi:STAS domain-containing protein [Plantactinospora sp. CA-294935]|uniref:STAS domain-containing protein n=1 Tax=Plantactinospora sp. CA-294935 TaxID=3240012 RepID=UPI003D8A6A0A
MAQYDTGTDGGHRGARLAVSMIELAVTGRLDHTAVPQVGVMFDAALQRGPDRIVLDVARCDYVDPAGIVLLLDLHRRSRHAGGTLELRGPSARLCRLFEIARVHHVLRVESGPPRGGAREAAAMGVARPPG